HSHHMIQYIIDHGGQVSTQYSHLSNISVSNGTKVNKGDVVGLVGSTGWSTGPHLHFTVYKNGQHASPWNWLR
ncbi:MAG TPA: M23 family metallopeptidase, partial [Thermoanaerobacterales bacterium]|nr:M23 family metallopeptidase [Thermoanaerobacterales bacterium]